jgi:mono/diheme cytochrome c family protein
MRRRATVVVFVIGVAATMTTLRSAEAPVVSIPPSRPYPLAQASKLSVQSTAPVRAVLDKYCVTCHNQKLKVAGLALDTMDVENVGRDADVWEKVAAKIRTHEMPPPGRPRPDRGTYAAVTSGLEAALDHAAAANPNPGSVPVHRLSRTEYANAIRDLLGLDIDVRSLLVADEPDPENFSNIASVLTVSPLLLEGYLSAALKVSRLAIGDPSVPPLVDTYQVPKALDQEDRTNDDLPFGSQGGVVIRHHFPVDGEYSVKVLLRRELYYYIMGMGEQHLLDVRIDGVRVKQFTVGGEAPGKPAPEGFVGNTFGDPEWEVYMQTADEGLELRVPVKAGMRQVAVHFVRQHREDQGVLQPPQRGFARSTNELYYDHPAVDTVLIGGPYRAAGVGDTPSRRKVFVCQPTGAASEEPCARTIFSTLARRAYRRPVTEKDIRTLLDFYKAGRDEGGFELGIQHGVERMLASPNFLFRVQSQPATLAPGTVYRISDLELASKLSFFLWSSIPDDELLDLAIRRKLSEPAVLEQQVHRMLRDPRSQALVDNFANQWLKLGKLEGVVPDVDMFPDFDENLREAMLEETPRFVGHQLTGDRSIIELLTANYTFVNERLARHYGIPNVYGSHFRRVTLDGGTRGGLLGHASVLTVTSYPNRTSPVLRGKWLLANMLGSPPPPPPPDVPDLKEADLDGRVLSVRERMEIHRKNPVCASCHQRMDPLGFSLENFDALGKWRTVLDGIPIDAAASLPDGSTFEGIQGLRKLLLSQQSEFVRTVTEKLLAYAIGRGVEFYDLPAVRKIASDAAEKNYRWSALIAGIVKSTPFTMGIVEDRSSEERVDNTAQLPEVGQ